jgi:TolB protein
MRSKLTPRIILIAVLCVCLTSEELWLKNALSANTGQIVFTSYRDGNFEIYVMDADGGNQENLTNHPAFDYYPDWSPDGASNTGRIAFTSFRDGNLEIYVMDADGGNQENLTNHPAFDYDPDWSPDGTKIAFVSRRDGGPSQVYVMDADGKNVIKLTEGPGEGRYRIGLLGRSGLQTGLPMGERLRSPSTIWEIFISK